MGRVLSKRQVSALVVIAVAGLSGCAGQPGVAASVGGERITDARVATLAKDYCDAVSKDFQDQGVEHPMSAVRRAALISLLMRSGAEQLAKEYSVKPGSTYFSKRAALETTAEQLPEGQGAAVMEIGSAEAYVSDVTTAVGRAKLAEQGMTNAKSDEAYAAGSDALSVWFAQSDLKIDPQYNLTVSDVQPRQVDNSTSFAWSALAKGPQAKTEEQYREYVAQLPANQTCGR